MIFLHLKYIWLYLLYFNYAQICYKSNILMHGKTLEELCVETELKISGSWNIVFFLVQPLFRSG